MKGAVCYLCEYFYALACMRCCVQNFFPGPIMEVTIGAQPCAAVVITDNATLGEFACVAPPGPGFGTVQLRVTVEGSGTGAIRFAYDAPVVTRVLGSPCDAAAFCSIQVRSSMPRCVAIGLCEVGGSPTRPLWPAFSWVHGPETFQVM